MQRLKSLNSTVIIPQELLDAADELRLLGNDAAHIEAKTYDTIGSYECEIAIELTKELLKAVYQYSNLVSKLRALKSQKPTRMPLKSPGKPILRMKNPARWRG